MPSATGTLRGSGLAVAVGIPFLQGGEDVNNTDLYDGSSLVQAAADYYISRSWTIGVQVNANAGSRHSGFGSLPQGVSALFKLARHF